MVIDDSILPKVGSIAAVCLLFYLVSVSDTHGLVLSSYADIGKALGVTKSKVQRLLKALASAGLVSTSASRSRHGRQGVAVRHISRYKSPPATAPLSVKDKEQREADFRERAKAFSSRFPQSMIVAFCDYWTESGDRERKLRFEKEKSFCLSRRLSRWKSGEKRNPMETGVVLSNSQLKDYNQNLW